MNDMELFDAMARPPKEALKTIVGGRLKGMSDIKPQWRIRAMTELYGLCGIGWKYTIDKQWLEAVDNGAVMCFTNISLFVKVRGSWSDAIPATGGSAVVEMEKNYEYKVGGTEPKKVPYANDEGYKMSLTDALSVAMQKIGIAGAIYEGQWDGSKYRTESKPVETKIPESGTEIAMALQEYGSQGFIPEAAHNAIEAALLDTNVSIEFLTQLLGRVKTANALWLEANGTVSWREVKAKKGKSNENTLV